MTNNHLLREDAAAVHVGLAKKSLQRRRWAGQPPTYIKIGTRVLYDVADLDAFISSGRVVR